MYIMAVSSNDLAIQRTKLANQRTYLAYMRTGFIIAAIAGAFKKYWIALFGIIMIFGSSLQYILINSQLSEKLIFTNQSFDYVPLIYVILSLGALYLHWKKT